MTIATLSCALWLLVLVLASQRIARKSRFKVQYKCLSVYGHPPTQPRSTDAGFDVCAAENVEVYGMTPVRTGVAIAVPEGYYYTVRGRSGLARDNQIDVFDGTIDATYCGELIITLINHGKLLYRVKRGDRIAQIVFHECCKPTTWERVEEFSPEYNIRGKAGFGSSGRQ